MDRSEGGISGVAPSPTQEPISIAQPLTLPADLPKLALSINQPWAWLIASGLKDIENRNWNTDFRGEFLIHAGLKIDRDCATDIGLNQHPVTGEPMEIDRVRDWPVGGLIGIAEIVDVITLRSGGEDNPWFVGRYGFVIRNARPVAFIPCVGALGFFTPDLTRTYKPKPPPVVREPKPRPATPVFVESGDLFSDGSASDRVTEAEDLGTGRLDTNNTSLHSEEKEETR